MKNCFIPTRGAVGDSPPTSAAFFISARQVPARPVPVATAGSLVVNVDSKRDQVRIVPRVTIGIPVFPLDTETK